jgi:transcriptional regulator with XRE-family HTH domain
LIRSLKRAIPIFAKQMETAVKYKTLGAYLKNARNKSNLSQWDVAKKIGYSSPQFISNLERGISSPPLKVLKILVDLYDISPREILEVIAEEQERILKRNLIKLRKALTA